MTEEMRVVLPSWDNKLAFHPRSLECSLSTKNWKSIILLPLNMKFMPKYLLGVYTKFTCKDAAKASWSSLEMFGEQKRSDLARLTH